MPYEIVTIPCLSDNYAFLIGNTDSAEAILVDVPEADPIAQVLDQRGWQLTHVLLTHHHWDHVDGLPDLAAAQNCKIVGAKADAHRLPDLDLSLNDGEEVTICGLKTKVIDVSGHTLGHIAFHMPEIDAVFTGDSLMALGCGRLFEGSHKHMFDSLFKLRALPDDTIVYSGHEYTAANAKFALTVDAQNPDLNKRAQDTEQAVRAGRPTVPSSLQLERATNPYLRADHPDLASALGMPGADPLQVFTEIRNRKDGFS